LGLNEGEAEGGGGVLKAERDLGRLGRRALARQAVSSGRRFPWFQRAALPPLNQVSSLNVKTRRNYIFASLIVITATALVLPAVQVCRDWAFIDLNTGSRKGYREWAPGWLSGSWYQESAIEAFMRSEHPSELRQEWVSYVGTGRNIFGGATVKGHGRPGPVLSLTPETIDEYCKAVSKPEKRRVYDVLSSGEPSKIRELVQHMSEASIPTFPGQSIEAGTN
jgi:hypothetical protein